MRLDFFVANTTGLSRKASRQQISQGEVTVDNEVCRKAATHLRPDQVVRWRQQTLALPGERYYMLNKPVGVVSATRDRDHTTALDLLPSELRPGLHVAGRLDIDTTGLLLLTTDGDWSHRITSPRHQCSKRYRVSLAEPLDATARRDLEQGVLLRNDPEPTRAALVEAVGERVIDLTISEGRYHQVKRMLAAVGNRVEALHRVQIGPIRLDPGLDPGAFRALTENETAAFSRKPPKRTG